MTPEQYLSNQCRLHAGKNNAMCFHINVGNFKLKDGSFLEQVFQMVGRILLPSYQMVLYFSVKLRLHQEDLLRNK